MLNNFLSPVAVIDSGIGGLKLLKELRKVYPGENYIYFADYEYMPYGNKRKAFIIKRMDAIVNALIEKYRVKLIVLACNTASISALSYLKNKYKIPILGVLPRVYGKNSLILSTKLTNKLINENMSSYFLSPSKRFRLDGCEKIGLLHFASFIENNFYDKKKIDLKLSRLEKDYGLSKYDNIILGCTHYEYIIDVFREHFKGVKIISPINHTINLIKASKLIEPKSDKTKGEIFMLSSSNYKSIIDKLYLSYNLLR